MLKRYVCIITGSQIQLQKKAVSDMFFNGELAYEIITAKAEEQYLFIQSSDREKHMEKIISTIAHGMYSQDCHGDCQAGGMLIVKSAYQMH